MPNGLSGQLAPITPSEGVAVTGTVATYTDSNTSDTAGDFTAVINWGDGTTTTGAVSGGNGAFTVSTSGHTYGDEGTFTATATLTRTSDNAQAAPMSTFTVGENDALTPHPATISVDPGTQFSGTVATFTDIDTSNVAGDFIATINWGDAIVSAGTVSGGNGTFTVTGFHTYAAAGQFIATVMLSDDAPGTAAATANSTANVGLSGQMALLTPSEGVAVTGTIATFTDSNTSNTAGDFTAVINWGDGTTTTGAVTGGNGTFTVSTSGHTYADEGTFTATATLKRTSDNAQAAPTSTFTVGENDALTPHPATISVDPGTQFSGTVATFTDIDTSNVAGDFIATINWGDAIVSAGTVSGGNGTFTVTGFHTYAAAGQFIATVALSDDAPGTAAATANSTANVGLSGQMALLTPSEGVAVTGTIATFTDSNTSNTAGDFTAVINWGDGTTTTGAVTGGNGTFTVSTSGHTYADEGTFTATATLKRTSDNAQAAPTSTFTVGENDALTPHPATISADPGTQFSGTVATFTDTDTSNVAGDFIATINWGDATVSAGTVSGGNGTFTVTGFHTYAAAGQFIATVMLSDDAPGTAAATANSAANVGLSGQMALLTPSEGVVVTGTIATFTDGDLGDTAGGFTAAINWGDGTTTTGAVSGGNGAFTVSTSGHTYADEGTFTATATLKRTSDNAQAAPTSTFTVGENDALTPHSATIFADPGTQFSGTVATFTDIDTSNVAGDFVATINWGDGSPLGSGVVSGGNGTFTVTGFHTYAAAGQASVTVTLSDDAPGTASGIVTSTANVGLSGQLVSITPSENAAVTGAIAAFTDSNTSDTAGDFTAVINWGDGRTTTGPVSGGNGTFTVSASPGHIYADEGSVPLTVTLKRTSDSAQAAPTGTVTVGEADTLTPHAVGISASQNQSFAGTLATFADTDTLNVAGDFTATINWGDGTRTAGTITGSNGSFSVSGTHTYAIAGQDSVTVTLSDDAPGTATATVTSNVTVAAAPDLRFVGIGDFDANTRSDIAWASNGGGQATLWMNNNGMLTQDVVPLAAMGAGTWTAYGVGDFNGDGKSDLLWTSNTGQVAVWETNGPNLIGFGVPAGQMGFPAWHVAAIGDFNGDGKSDLLWVNNNGGHAAVWTMNGTALADFALSNGAMGSEWSVLGTGDFNRDGRADVLWENTSGTVDIWEMNGANLSGFDANVGTAPGRFAGVGHFTGVAEMGNKTSDIVWVDNTNHVTIWEMNGGQIAKTVSLNGLDGLAWHLEGVGNFGGDANSDLLWINNTTGAVNIWEVNGSNVTEIPVNAPTGSTLQLKAGTQSQPAQPSAPQLLTLSDSSPLIGGLTDGSKPTHTLVGG